MSENENHEHSSRQNRLLVGLAAIIFAECALLGAVTVYLVIELVVAKPDSYASAVALVILTTLAAVGLAVIGVSVLRRRSWVRGAIVTWQVLQIAIGIGCFQGLLARPDVGWLLVAPALAALVLLFTRPVVEATARRDA